MLTWFGLRSKRSSIPTKAPRRRSFLRSVLRAEALEDRILPSLSPTLLKNINPGNAGSYPQSLTQVNGLIFFEAVNDGDAELWRSDGTAAGTILLKDFFSSARNAPLTDPTSVNGTLFFLWDDGSPREALWRSNGTPAGTVQIGVLNYPADLTNLDGTLFFVADNGSHEEELWRSNGTPAGTALVQGVNPATTASYPYDPTNVNGTLFFFANATAHGAELWRSNGTITGTKPVHIFGSGAYASYLRGLTNVNGTAFFSAGEALWKSDGTNSGTVPVKSFAGDNLSGPTYSTNVSGTLFFGAIGQSDSVQLWESNGTAAGTLLVKDIGYVPKVFTDVNGTVFFQANDYGMHLWESNGTSAGTFILKDINTGGVEVQYSSYLTNCNGTLFFSDNNGTHGTELWQSNGTASGTRMVKDIFPSGGGSYPRYLTNVRGTLFFQANDGTHGAELWRSNRSSAGTVLVADINRTPVGSYPGPPTNVNGTLFFAANDNIHGSQLWRTNGTPAGTVLVKDITPGLGLDSGSVLYDLTNVNGTLFFITSGFGANIDLWRSDGTAAGTVPVKEVAQYVASPDGAYFPGDLTSVGGTLFFDIAFVSAYGGFEALWESNGTAAGTLRLPRVPFSSSGYPLFFTNVSGSVFFAADDGTRGPVLWKSNGTSAGTVPVSSIPQPDYMLNVNGTLFFRAFDNELWKSNGTAAGTVRLTDVQPQSANYTYSYSLTNVNGTVFFTESNGVGGRDLWSSNGTAAGTVLVSDIVPGERTRYEGPPFFHPSRYCANVNGTLFLEASDGIHGAELWESNGTKGGTFLVKDITPGRAGSYPYWLTNVDGTLFFSAGDGTHGNELWASNGSAAGTFLVHDINPGAASSNPKYLTNMSGTLFFSANDGVHGTELWTLPPPFVSAASPASGAVTQSITGSRAADDRMAKAGFDAALLDPAPGSGIQGRVDGTSNPLGRLPAAAARTVDEVFAQRSPPKPSLHKTLPRRPATQPDWLELWWS